jgi:hypothetical protein
MIFRLAVLVLGVLAIQLAPVHAMATQWVTIDKSEQHLTLGIERLVDWKRVTKKRYVQNSVIRQELSTYLDSRYQQVLQVFVYELQGGYLLKRQVDFEDVAKLFKKFKSVRPPLIKESFNGLSTMRYGIFEFEGNSCVIFFQNFGSVSAHDGGDNGTAYLAGNHCDLAGNKIDDAKAVSLIKSIGFVGVSGPMSSENDEAIWRTSSGS